MSTLGTYSFLPWLRQGLANQIESADLDASVKVRARVSVKLELKGEKPEGGTPETRPVDRPVALFGPGDIVGIERRAIVRVEPVDWTTDFEPNYLPAIEFYDEDFPWRYTPAAPDAARGRLRPWIALVVLAEGEFEDGKDLRNKPLPYVEVSDLGVFPPAGDLWAWAHVHVNRSLAGSDAEFVSKDMTAVLPRFRAVLQENPDLAYSRIVCPRKLAPNTPYHAFLMPVFETGRLAGLGLDPEKSPHATFSAWEIYPDKPETASFPCYHRWYFRTGASGDFESLVRLIVPKPVNPRVGTREMDVTAPGANVRPLNDPDLGGILKLGGALRVPEASYTKPEDLAEFKKYDQWADPYPQPIQRDLATLINLADDYAALAAEDANARAGIPDPEHPDDLSQTDPDPLITAPLYGTWHALTKRLLVERDGTTPVELPKNWVHELNLDPRFRVAAGFGTRVVQDQQEKYMDAAWEQLGRVLEANQRIRLGQLGKEVSFIWYDRHLRPLLGVSREKALLLMAPLNKRVLSGEFTVHHHLTESHVQPALTSTALRRVLRPRGRLLKAMPWNEGARPENLIDRVNEGEVSVAPPKVAPPGVVTIDQVAEEVGPKNAPSAVTGWLRRHSWTRWLLVLLVVLLSVCLPVLAIVFVLLGLFVFRRLSRWTGQIEAEDALREESRTPESVDRLPKSPDFVISEPGSGVTPRIGATDSVEAERFKRALGDAYTLIEASGRAGAEVPKKRLDLPALAQGTFVALNPEITVPKRILAGIFLPPRIRAEIGEQFVEAMAYPEIDIPMYEPLKNLSAELFLPNLHLIEQNSATLLETNQKFIESYMVGLNHEFARELLWREYPTDQRGSCFRQFWDVRSFFNATNLSDEDLRERLRDIPPIHRWPRASELGDHDHREQAGDKEEEVVLVIRGELLKRYPNTVVYAHRACWQRKGDGSGDPNQHPCTKSGPIDNTKERRLAPLTAAEEDKPPLSKVRTPLYQAQVEPDIYFFGFDLNVLEAKGGTGENPNDDPGWFFVLKERPGEPRFGLDTDKQPELHVWNDLSWADVQPGPAGYIEKVAEKDFSLHVPTGEDSEKGVQHQDDVKILWKPSQDVNAADLAYILFQAPVLVAIHASEMLPK